jgi:hypothetical protein
MSDQKPILERYRRDRYRDQWLLHIARLEKLRDGWESDNYLLSLEFGAPRTRTNWMWRIYSGIGSEAKAAREFTAMRKLFAAGYPAPQVLLLAVLA